jgi:anti-sigma regulatory factor (Ser/Thr protein kinase)
MISADPPAPRAPAPAHTLVPEVVAVDHRFDADGLYALRAELAAHADHLGATAQEIHDLLIVASELATNAIRHGGGGGRLRMWRDGSHLRCLVTDQGPGMVDPEAGTTTPEPRAVSGRGLWIARQVCSELTVDTGPDGTTILIAIALAATHHPDVAENP